MAWKNEVRAKSGLPPLVEVERVQPFSDLVWAWQGWWRLSNARPQGFAGPTRIQVQEIEAYCRLRGWPVEKREDFDFYIENLDEVYMDRVRKVQEEEDRKNKATGGKKPGGGRR